MVRADHELSHLRHLIHHAPPTLPSFLTITSSEDLAYTSVTGIAVARLSRHRYESKGIPVGELRITEAKGPHAAVLPRCLKVYLPPPDGPFGMVFRLMIDGDGAHLQYLAFGGRRGR